MSRSRNWCFTINNPTDDDIIICDTIECSYIVYGYEIGDSGTPHLQGYIELDNAKSLRSIKKDLGGRVHLETRLGSAKEASDYCKKDETFFERGIISTQGKRSDLEKAAELVKLGGVKAVANEMPHMVIKFPRGLDRLAELLMKERIIKPYVVWLWGTTGTGKTYTATRLAEDKTYYIWTGTKWWNGYTQQDRIVIDDYSYDGTDYWFRYLLRLLHEYECQVETKGGQVHVNSSEIYITCEFPPHLLFKEGNELNQVLRRINEIRELKIEDINYESDIIPVDVEALSPQIEPSDNIVEDELAYI